MDGGMTCSKWRLLQSKQKQYKKQKKRKKKN
jgi:hypothetical protein